MSAGISGLIANTVELLVNAVSVFKVNGDGAIGVNDSYGEAGQVLKSGGSSASAEFGSAINSSATVTASGTAVDFTGIPSWVKRITVMFSGVSTNGTSAIEIQIGGASIETTGYEGSGGVYVNAAQSVVATSASGFLVYANTATSRVSGAVVISNLSSNLWVASGALGDGINNYVYSLGGSKTLSGVLEKVRIKTRNGTDTFDAGSVNIMWE